jgi:hypothetical protein
LRWICGVSHILWELVREGHGAVCLMHCAACFPNKFGPTGVRPMHRHRTFYTVATLATMKFAEYSRQVDMPSAESVSKPVKADME